MRRLRRYGLRLFIVLVLLGLVAGHAAGHSRHTPRPAARIVVAGAVARCMAVAVTSAQQHQGLQRVAHPAPLLFRFAVPSRVGFWMLHTPAPLTGVWISPAGRVAGYWHGLPDSLAVHLPRRPVSMVIEYPAGRAVPRLGALVTVGQRCRTGGAL